MFVHELLSTNTFQLCDTVHNINKQTHHLANTQFPSAVQFMLTFNRPHMCVPKHTNTTQAHPHTPCNQPRITRMSPRARTHARIIFEGVRALNLIKMFAFPLNIYSRADDGWWWWLFFAPSRALTSIQSRRPRPRSAALFNFVPFCERSPSRARTQAARGGRCGGVGGVRESQVTTTTPTPTTQGTRYRARADLHMVLQMCVYSH